MKFKIKRNATVEIILCFLFLTAIIGGIIYYVKNENEKQKKQSVTLDLLVVQCMCKLYKSDALVGKKDIPFANNNSSLASDSDAMDADNESGIVGTKLSEYDDDIINDFKAKNIIDESDYDNFYVLSNDDLKKLNASMENRPNSYYLINYDNWEVILTKGYKGLYKLSDIMHA